MPQGSPETDSPVGLNGRRLIHALATVAALLALGGVLVEVSIHVAGHNWVYGLVPLFELDREGNVPTWFQSAVLLLDAALAWLLAARLRAAGVRFRGGDLVMAGLLVYLSADDAAQFHERLRFPIGTSLAAERFYYYTWLIPAAALLAVAVVGVHGFFRGLPADVRRRAALACAIYLAGAFGMELVGGLVAMQTGPDHLGYSLVTVLEETLEMAGQIAFAAAMFAGLEGARATLAFAPADRGFRTPKSPGP